MSEPTEPKKQKFFLDTEFIEAGRHSPVKLISIGIVAEDGREFYAESQEFDSKTLSQWLKENVLPHLGPVAMRKPVALIAKEVLAFIGDAKPEFWGYYADYDWVVFCQMFGSMIDLPKGWPMYCRDIKQLCDSLGNPRLPNNDTAEHNALSDARWNAKALQFLLSEPSNVSGALPVNTELPASPQNTLAPWTAKEDEGCATLFFGEQRWDFDLCELSRLESLADAINASLAPYPTPDELAWMRAHESERKTVHEWLNALDIPREESGNPICLLRRLSITCDRLRALEGPKVKDCPICNGEHGERCPVEYGSVSEKESLAPCPQIWREADDLIICKLPGREEFRISNEGARSMFVQLREVVHGKEARPATNLAEQEWTVIDETPTMANLMCPRPQGDIELAHLPKNAAHVIADAHNASLAACPIKDEGKLLGDWTRADVQRVWSEATGDKYQALADFHNASLGLPEAKADNVSAVLQNDGISLIAAERQRQLKVVGWTDEHDDTHKGGALAMAAAVYAIPFGLRVGKQVTSWLWPFEKEWYQPSSSRIRDLEKSGALIAAEIDRLLRKAQSVSDGGGSNAAGASSETPSPLSEEETGRCGAYAERGFGEGGLGCEKPKGHKGNHGNVSGLPSAHKAGGEVTAVSDAEVDQFMREFDAGLHPLSPDDKSALHQKSKG